MPHPGWVVARKSEALDDETGRDAADPRREESAHDPAGEPIRDEDREVPDRDADHRPDEDAHACSATAPSRPQTIVGRGRAMPRAWRCPATGGMGPGLYPDR